MAKMLSGRTLLNTNLLEERYGRSFLLSIAIHIAVVAFFIVAPFLFPSPSSILIGTGAGGGTGGETYEVGLTDELAGGTGMFKPSLIPQPPPLTVEEPAKEEIKQEAIPLPQTVEKIAPPKHRPSPVAKEAAPDPNSNVIPTDPKPGAGGTGGKSGGALGGRGGGIGVQIGDGSGGFGDFWYARAIESRIGSNWIKPQGLARIEIVYSFFIMNNGRIRDIKREKSSGNHLLDLSAERAIRASDPFPPLPPEFRGRAVQFISQFIYPPDNR